MHTVLKVLSTLDQVALYGYGREGRSTEVFLRTNFPNLKVDIWEDDESNQPIGKNDVALKKLADYPLIIKSPGISLYKESLKNLHDRCTSNLEIWLDWNQAQATPTKTIVITGTKGKSTSSSLLHHAFKQLGYECALLGNIGTPALDQTKTVDFAVIEASSYQLTNLSGKIDFGLILNLSPEHQDWHLSQTQYYTDKTQFFQNQNPAKIFVNQLNHNLPDYFDNGFSKFNNTSGWHVKDDDIYYGPQLVIDSTNIPLLGPHNRSNIAGVMSVLSAALEDTHFPNNLFSNFQPLEHRLEKITDHHGNIFFNDSISTTPMATQAALESIAPKKVILIMGGQDRGQNYNDFFKHLKTSQIEQILLLPQNADLINAAIKKAQIPLTPSLCTDLTEAVKRAKNLVTPENVVLLSPGAPSYGIYKNFEARGQHFKDLISH